MTLRLKILASMALVLAVTVGGSFLVLIRYERAQLLRNTADATFHLANTIRATLEHAMLTNDPEEMRRIVLTVGKQPGVEGVFVLDHAAVVRVASNERHVGQPLPDAPTNILTGANGESGWRIVEDQPSPLLRITSLIPNAPGCQRCHPPARRILGALVVDRSLREMEQQLQTNLAYMLGSAGLAFLLLTATTYWVLRRVVITPLADLGQAAQAIRGGEYQRPLVLDRSDEVGDLSRTLDQMRCRILEHLDEIRRWGEQLELRVAEQTQELRALNRVALVTNEALDLPTMFTRALEAALDALGIHAAAIILVAPGPEGPLVVQQGLSESEVEVLTRQASQLGTEVARAEVAAEGVSRAFACFPISKGASVGVLCADSSVETPLVPEKLRLLEALAAQLGGAMERAILHRNLERSFTQLQASQAAVVERERQIAALEAVRAATVTLSHHINNATAGISGCRNVLAMSLGEQGDAQAQYALEGIRACVNKITSVLRTMQDLPRIELTPFAGGTLAIDVEDAIRKRLADPELDERHPNRHA